MKKKLAVLAFALVASAAFAAPAFAVKLPCPAGTSADIISIVNNGDGSYTIYYVCD